MSATSLTNTFKSIGRVITKHSPEILTGLGIAGMISTTVLAVKATPKAVKILDEYKEAVLRDHEKIKPVDAVKLTWKCYVPAVVTGTASVACLIGASKVSLKRNAALATAYSLSETALREYKDAVVETVGEKKEKVVKEKVAAKKIIENPVQSSEVIITGDGETMCYDNLCGRYFKSDRNHIDKVVNVLNRRLRTEMYISLNDFYSEIGLPPVDVGYYIGWNIDRDSISEIEIDYGAHLMDDDTPCMTIGFVNRPEYNFDKF